jgi:tetratricopeptide (TPR) repeat protein
LTSIRRRFTLRDLMKRKIFLFPLLLAAGLLAGGNAFAQTNVSTVFTNDATAQAYLEIQAQLHATQLAIDASRQLAAEEAQKNADTLNARLLTLEQTVAAQRTADAEAARRSQQFTLLVTGIFGVAGLGILLLMVFFQWRAFAQIAQISEQQQLALANAGAVHQLAAPGRAAVEVSNARLLDVVGQLEKKILELESGHGLLAETPAIKSADPLANAQTLLDAGQPQKALDALERLLAAQPEHPEALVKKAAALEKLGRLDDALASCDRALAANAFYTGALLAKGGLLNKLNRHAEAIDCFEQTLLAQEKKARS